MDRNLEHLINLARQYREENALSEAETSHQVRSFAFGNTHLENDAITRDDIDRAVESLRAENVERPART
jgi:hypothetical protein